MLDNMCDVGLPSDVHVGLPSDLHVGLPSDLCGGHCVSRKTYFRPVLRTLCVKKDTSSILTALYIVIICKQMQYVHI